MTNDDSTKNVHKNDAVGRRESAIAVAEVCLATFLTLLAYKILKTVEPPGFNCSPGFTMIVAATLMLLLHRRDFASYGVASDRWRYALNVGVAFSLIQLVSGLIEVAVFQTGSQTPLTIPTHVALSIALIRIPVYVILFLILTRAAWKNSIHRVPIPHSIFLLTGLLLASPAIAILRGAPAWQVAGLAVSLLFFTAFGEELFFRGYVQSRLNGVFARPWQLIGVSFGPGLLISSLLFGVIHLFNPTRPFEGHWELSWLWGASGFLGGLLYGYLRELTGSIWAGTIVHGSGGVYRGISQVFLFK